MKDGRQRLLRAEPDQSVLLTKSIRRREIGARAEVLGLAYRRHRPAASGGVELPAVVSALQSLAALSTSLALRVEHASRRKRCEPVRTLRREMR